MMQLNYVLDFPQTTLNKECYMKIPKVIELKSDTKRLIKTKKNIHRQYQSEIVWNKFLVGKLPSLAVEFRKNKINECVFYCGKTMYILYTADYILAVPDEEELR